MSEENEYESFFLYHCEDLQTEITNMSILRTMVIIIVISALGMVNNELRSILSNLLVPQISVNFDGYNPYTTEITIIQKLNKCSDNFNMQWESESVLK